MDQRSANLASGRAGVALLHDEGSYLGIIGALALVNVGCDRNPRSSASWFGDSFRREHCGFLWIFLYFSTGGLNAIAGAFGFTYLRSGCRLSVFILAIALLFAAEWLSRRQLQRGKSDCTRSGQLPHHFCWTRWPIPPSTRRKKPRLPKQVSSDEKFVRDLEKYSAARRDGLSVTSDGFFRRQPLRTESSYDQLRPLSFLPDNCGGRLVR